MNADNRAGGRAEDLVFHLHRFQHEQQVVRLDMVALLDLDIKNVAGHRGRDLCRAGRRGGGGQGQGPGLGAAAGAAAGAGAGAAGAGAGAAYPTGDGTGDGIADGIAAGTGAGAGAPGAISST